MPTRPASDIGPNHSEPLISSESVFQAIRRGDRIKEARFKGFRTASSENRVPQTCNDTVNHDFPA